MPNEPEHIQKSSDVKWTLLEHWMMKAKSSDVQSLFDLSWQHENDEGDGYEKRRLVRFAEEHGMLHLLPDGAHSVMHDLGVGHNHEGIENDEHGMHQHTVTKAINVVTFDSIIEKSWTNESTSDVHYEGWLSTPSRDLQRDIVEPESFLESLPGYFNRRAPVSVIHNKQTLPAGHLQKAAVIRDGKVLLTVDHPSDPGDFTALPEHGSGVWVLGHLTESPAKEAVQKGNCGGMSFIGNATEFIALPGGGRRYTKINPLLESTVAPYPINTDAYMAVIKAFGLEEDNNTKEPEPKMTDEEFNELLAGIVTQAKEREAAEQANAQNNSTPPVQKSLTFTQEQFDKLINQAKESAAQTATQEITKAFDTMRAQPGIGRQSTMVVKSDVELRDEDPVSYILAKCAAAKDGDESLSWEDKDYIASFTKRMLFDDLS